MKFPHFRGATLSIAGFARHGAQLSPVSKPGFALS